MVAASNIDSSLTRQVNNNDSRAELSISDEKSAEKRAEFAGVLGELQEDEATTAAQNLARIGRWDQEIARGWQEDPFRGMDEASLPAGKAKDPLTAQNQQLGQNMAALLAKAQGKAVYHQGTSSAEGKAASKEKADFLLNLPLGPENSAAPASTHGHNLLNFMLQQNLPLPATAGETIPVIDLSTLETHDLSTIINRITAYLAQNHWAQRPSIAVQVLQQDLGKFFVRADALPNGKIDVQILSSASEFFMQHQDNIRTALADAGVKLGDLKIIEHSTLDTDTFLAQHQRSDEQGRSEQQLAQDDRARRYRLWQQAYLQQEA